MYGLYPCIELFQNNGGYRGGRADLAYDNPSIPLDGRERSVDRCRRALLDGDEINIMILMGGQMSPTSSAPDSRYASVLCRAFNEWSLERWVAEGERFRLALTVCANDPQGAVEEIERVAASPVEIEPTSDGLTIRGIPFEVI